MSVEARPEVEGTKCGTRHTLRVLRLRDVGAVGVGGGVLAGQFQDFAARTKFEDLLALHAESLGREAVDNGIGSVAQQREELGDVKESLASGVEAFLEGLVDDGEDDGDEVRRVGDEEHRRDGDEDLGVLPV